MPAWERNGRELFYRDGTKAVAVSVLALINWRTG